MEDDEEQQQPQNHRHPLAAIQQRQQQQQEKNEEDIDIVGDGKEKNNTSIDSGSSEVQNHVYGPPQFTEADVLACVKQQEEDGDKEERKDGDEDEEAKENGIKKEVDDEEKDGEDDKVMDAEGEEEGKDVEKLKAKLRAVEDSSKCSKCTVS